MWKYDLALLLGVVVLYAEVIFGSAQVIGRDALHYLIPIGAALREGYLGNGSLLWDSGLDHGLPVIARWSPMVFYPGQWLFALFKPATALSVGIILHLALTACATLRLALRYTERVEAAWVAAFCFAYGGYLISVSVGGGYCFGAALLPVSLLSFHRLAERPTLGRSVATAAVVALQIFCADPQTLLYEGVILVPPVLLFHRRESGTLRRRWALGVLATLLALGLSTCQWLPSLEFAGLSIRGQGSAIEGSDAWQFHPLRLVQFLSPHVLGTVTPENTLWARSLVNAKIPIPWAPFLYHGLVVWAGVVAVDWRRSRRSMVVAGLTLFFLVLAMGHATPVHGLVLQLLPGAKLFRYPEKFLLFVALGVSLLGARGIGRLLGELTSPEPAARRRRLRVTAAIGGLGAVAAGLRLWLDPSSSERLAWFAGLLVRQRSEVSPGPALAITASSLLHTAGVAAAIAGLCFLALRLRPALWVALGAAVVAADVLPASLTQRCLADAAPYQVAPGALAALPPQGSGQPPLVWWTVLPAARKGPVRKGRGAAAFEGTPFERQRQWDWNVLKPNVGTMYGIRYGTAYEAAQLRSHHLLDLAADEDLDRLLPLMGIQYLITRSGAFARERFEPVLTSDRLDATVYRVPGPLPFAHPVERAETSGAIEQAVGRLAEKSFDFTRGALFDRNGPSADFGAAARSAQVKSYRPGEILVELDFAAPGYLVLAESYYPGWRAEDGAGAIVVERANAHFLGVEVPAGKRTVRFEFDPPLQRRASLVSLAAWALAVVLALTGHLRLFSGRPA